MAVKWPCSSETSQLSWTRFLQCIIDLCAHIKGLHLLKPISVHLTVAESCVKDAGKKNTIADWESFKGLIRGPKLTNSPWSKALSKITTTDHKHFWQLSRHTLTEDIYDQESSFKISWAVNVYLLLPYYSTTISFNPLNHRIIVLFWWLSHAIFFWPL